MINRFFCIFLILFLFIPFKPVLALENDYGKQSLVGADFSNTDLRGATFYLTNLQNANLSGSDLEGASLFGAKLQDTDLSNANLRNATLDSAFLEGTNLSNAFLEDAFAFSTRFKNVNISGSDFTNVLITGEEHKYLCSIANGVNPVSNKKTIDTLDCNTQ
ncbi:MULTISPECIES: pentapeptide repeat-containing protein [Prochlorococcus]|uniref:pentapeptide repeat-containing protein n=1 Tax=Prochlorococcus TaxID=1218 RepID=UPI000533B4EA|nr:MULTISPECIES: pentapeptide repeat-containing protein [Prochlorococcus]KGG12578.1 putative thylakoid membrane protein [Prochlorococcus sp. MIT 0601]